MLFLLGIEEYITNSLIFGGGIGAYVLYRIFEWKRIWILYINLRFSKLILLSVAFGIYELCSLIVIFILQRVN